MDDIAGVGMPASVWCICLSRDERDTGGSDSSCPTHLTVAAGNITLNPMGLNSNKHGLQKKKYVQSLK
jgi:hypothetical protein